LSVYFEVFWLFYFARAVEFVSHVPVDLLVLGLTVKYLAAEGTAFVGGFLADCAFLHRWSNKNIARK